MEPQEVAINVSPPEPLSMEEGSKVETKEHKRTFHDWRLPRIGDQFTKPRREKGGYQNDKDDLRRECRQPCDKELYTPGVCCSCGHAIDCYCCSGWYFGWQKYLQTMWGCGKWWCAQVEETWDTAANRSKGCYGCCFVLWFIFGFFFTMIYMFLGLILDIAINLVWACSCGFKCSDDFKCRKKNWGCYRRIKESDSDDEYTDPEDCHCDCNGCDCGGLCFGCTCEGCGSCDDCCGCECGECGGCDSCACGDCGDCNCCDCNCDCDCGD
eukprot:TRINITY_DN17309_c0_g1_i1.p1 TRINITY_DN17309_c0_g1~~TRINITY_DN17309_c0_g1_i1.p1  ORF type:complete len:268 (-),score=6.82 TRINITY_DN17309_c0_g1_i1:3-806(-)